MDNDNLIEAKIMNFFDKYVEDIDNNGNFTLCSEFEDLSDGDVILVVGLIDEIKKHQLPSNKIFYIATIIDLHGTFELLLLENEMKNINENLDKSKPIVFKIKIKQDDNVVQFKILDIVEFEEFNKPFL